MASWYPFIVLGVGVAIVIGGIVVLRVNAFIALITAAIVVSLMAGGDVAAKVERVAQSFGSTAASIGIVIALAAVIGQAMMDSGAADRIVRAFLAALGEKRATLALSGSGFVLSIPVFFDTAFYLLVPLVRSAYRRTGRHYLKLLMSIVAGAAVTHTLVPPTPGPLFIANQLGVDLGAMVTMGLIVGVPATAAGLIYGRWLDARMPIEMRPLGEQQDALSGGVPDDREPGLIVSLAPILLPILLITANSVVKMSAHAELAADPGLLSETPVARYALAAEHGGGLGVVVEDRTTATKSVRVLTDGEITEALGATADKLAMARVFQWTNVLGNPNLALLLSAGIAVATLQMRRKPTKMQMASTVETALMSAGVIILITAAGGAFGGMLKTAGLGEAVQHAFGGTATRGIALLAFAFGIASLIKFAQGSSTAAMIVTGGMISAMVSPVDLPYHPVYLALSIGSGSLVGSWMNDSGFWIYSKMGGLSEVETLKSWTPLLAIVGVTAGAVTVMLAVVMPMR